MRQKIVFVVGARPNFVKLSALLHAARDRPEIAPFVIHTGQHHDHAVSGSFFDDLDLPPPDAHLGVSSGSPVQRIARMMERLEEVLRAQGPARVVVVGDVDSTLAAALVASRLGLPLAHVEAGLRSFDPRMPEENNRRIVDILADLLFATEDSALANLAAEGIPSARVHLVGNVMVDTLLRFRGRAAARPVLETLGLKPREYGVVTLHRPLTVDRWSGLGPLLDTLATLAGELPLIFPVHPRTRASVPAGWSGGGLRLVDPLGYLDFLAVLDSARIVLTDSGGVQEETTVLAVPCLTLRDQTERPATVVSGTNRIVGTEPDAVRRAWQDALGRPAPAGATPPLWDGRAAERILDVLQRDPLPPR